MTNPTTIDLFCGAGGMSTGFKQAGFNIVAAIDNDVHAVRSFETNHPDVQHVLQRSLERNDLNPRELEEIIGLSTIDLLIGGPPCQGFSLASMNPKAKATFGPNKHKRDSRNSLYRRFFDYIEHFKPSVFVMENVPTLRKKTNGYYKTQIEKLAKKLNYGVSFWKLNAADYGVPQTRTRLFIIGFADNMEMQIPAPTNSSDGKNLPKHITVCEAILDLPPLKAGDGSDVMSYEGHQPGSHKTDSKRPNNYARWVRNSAKELRHHHSRPHSKRDLSIFKLLQPGKTSAQLPKSKQSIIPYSMKSFRDKYRRQSLDSPATTITAHIAKDGLYYIHPTQLRSFTPREAARIQSFHDTYIFSKFRTPTFRLIGNAVPPLLSYEIGKSLKKELK